MDKYLIVHIAFNLIGLICEFFHGHYAEERNPVLQATFLFTIWLCLIGGFLKLRILSDDYLPIRLLSVQQLQFLFWICLAMAGHALL
ncbi:MAG: hypothetical protein HQK54_18255 [Oligoflexales bacterium]|nr:hypothetical protein [Oligoflexales bacterium]